MLIVWIINPKNSNYNSYFQIPTFPNYLGVLDDNVMYIDPNSGDQIFSPVMTHNRIYRNCDIAGLQSSYATNSNVPGPIPTVQT